MGDGVVNLSSKGAKAVVVSLNDMFGANGIKTTAANFSALSKLYPQLLQYDPKQTDPRKVRQSTLRFAAWVLTSDVVFSGPNVNTLYPADKFIKWLKYCRWLDVSNEAKMPVTLNGQDPGQPPAQVIANTLYTALTAKTPIPVAFGWDEDPDVKATSLEVTCDPKNPPFVIDVTSPKADDIQINDDGDDFQDH
jgi:hypothetical protein